MTLRRYETVNPRSKVEKRYGTYAHRLGDSDLFQVEFNPRGLQQWRGAGGAPPRVPPGYRATVEVSGGAARFVSWDRVPEDPEAPAEYFEREAERVARREDFVERGRRLYEGKLRGELEPENAGRFLAVDPDSENYFLGDTDVEALTAAREAMPDSLFYLVRVGYGTAHAIGGHAVRNR
jgi:hypothetical protein